MIEVDDDKETSLQREKGGKEKDERKRRLKHDLKKEKDFQTTPSKFPKCKRIK